MPSLSLEEMARRTLGLTSNISENFSGNLSGIYHVRETELSQGVNDRETIRRTKIHSNVKKPIKLVQCMVRFLDNSNYTFECDKNAKGQVLLEQVFKHLEILEKDYFGLQFVDNRSQYNQKFLNSHLLHLKGFSVNNSSSDLEQNETQEIFWKWLDSGKSIKHQFKSDPPFKLYFKVRFFVSDPSKLQDENTRYHFFLQIRNDILDGKLIYSHSALVKLSGYVVQSELGDYDSFEHKEGYLKDLELVPMQNLDIENEITELHKLNQGQSPAQAEFSFLQHSKNLDTYGIERFRAKNANNQNIEIGVGSIGIVIFENGLKVNSFVWSKIIKLSFKSKYFYVQLRRENHIEKYETIVCFSLLNYRQCKSLWKSCVQHHTFFRLQTPKPQTKKLFFFLSLGSQFRYSGRTEFQALEESRRRLRPTDKNFSRTSSKRYARQTVPSLHSSGQQVINESYSNKRANDLSAISSINDITDASNQSTSSSFWKSNLSSKLLNGLSLSVMKHNMRSLTKLNSADRRTNNGLISKLVTSTSNSELKSCKRQEMNKSNSSNRLNSSLSNQRLNNGGANSLTRKQQSRTNTPVIDKSSDDQMSTLNSINKTLNHKSSTINHQPLSTALYTHRNTSTPVISNANLLSTIKSVGNSCLSKMQVKESSTRKATEAWKNDESSPTNEASPVVTVDCISTQNSRDELSTSSTSNSSKSSAPLSRNNLAFTDKFNENTNEIIDAITNASFSENSKLNGKNLRLNLLNDDSPTNPIITVKMKPSDDNKFGFNVKGGSDQNLPVIVTKVAENTPAEGKLNEGDQVVSINGHDVENIKHEEVIKLIRSIEDRSEDGELVLAIRSNVYNQGLATDPELNGREEPAFLYNPVDSSLSKNKKKFNKELDLSIMLLYEGLDNGSLVDQFERMPCEKPDEDIIVAKLSCNLLKNRYRDISPYDSTRVKIRSGTDEDYINASHVNMEIPGTGIVNRYIATQGPLYDTTQDFWQMVYEQKSTLIVMVTPLVENDFIKCYKYWPDLNETLKLHDDMKLTCIKQTESNIMVERKFNLVKGGKKRLITHLLYKQWPDHGVPDDSTHFHQLINTVRRYRASMNNEPIIVHCSAGIGRTGVLILMETALCLIEQNLPVYPLELLKTMRDQRARLIQTPSQFTFVLQAIHDIYQKENQIKPEVEKR